MPKASVVSIVDDDESVRESLTGLVRSFGYEARPFASAEEFLASASAVEADCIILDVTMPGMNGEEVQEQLTRALPSPPIVFITARTEAALHRRLLDRGAVACLIKPFSEEALLSAVRQCLELREKGEP